MRTKVTSLFIGALLLASPIHASADDKPAVKRKQTKRMYMRNWQVAGTRSFMAKKLAMKSILPQRNRALLWQLARLLLW